MKYEIVDIPQPENCEKCTPCMRLRLMEIGFIKGEKIEIEDIRLGLWIVNILSENGGITSRIALRQEEIERMCIRGV